MIAQRTSRAQPIYVNDKPIGYVTGDTFHKGLKGSKHLLQRPPAICFDRCTLRDAAVAGATRVAIRDGESGTTYTASLETIERFGFPVRRKHGDQVGLALDHWSVNGAAPVAQQRAAATNQGRIELQMSLFGEVTQ